MSPICVVRNYDKPKAFSISPVHILSVLDAGMYLLEDASEELGFICLRRREYDGCGGGRDKSISPIPGDDTRVSPVAISLVVGSFVCSFGNTDLIK